jgi:hypothetical protein
MPIVNDDGAAEWTGTPWNADRRTDWLADRWTAIALIGLVGVIAKFIVLQFSSSCFLRRSFEVFFSPVASSTRDRV